MTLDLFSITIIFFGLGLGALVKGMAGNGLPLVAVPIIAIFLGVEHAVVAIQIPNIVSNIWLFYVYRSELKNAPLNRKMVIPSITCIIVGVWFLNSADKYVTILILTFILGGFLLLLSFKPDFKLEGRLKDIITPIASCVGGFAQGVAGISGPIFAPLLYSLKLTKEGYLFYNGYLYGIFNAVQLVTFIGLGMFTAEYFLEGLLALIPLAIFQYLGMRVSKRLSLKDFNRVVVFILCVVEGTLIWSIIG